MSRLDPARHERMPSMRSAMTAFPYSIDHDDTVEQARRMMREHEIGHLPVKQGDELVGILRARDLEQAGGAAIVGAFCSRQVLRVAISARLDEVLAEMAGRHLDAAVVVKDGRLAGIFTATDAFRVFAELLRAIYPKPGGDRAA